MPCRDGGLNKCDWAWQEGGGIRPKLEASRCGICEKLRNNKSSSEPEIGDGFYCWEGVLMSLDRGIHNHSFFNIFDLGSFERIWQIVGKGVCSSRIWNRNVLALPNVFFPTMLILLWTFFKCFVFIESFWMVLIFELFWMCVFFLGMFLIWVIFVECFGFFFFASEMHIHIYPGVKMEMLWHCSQEMAMVEGSLEVKLPTIWTD